MRKGKAGLLRQHALVSNYCLLLFVLENRVLGMKACAPAEKRPGVASGWPLDSQPWVAADIQANGEGLVARHSEQLAKY